MSKHLQIEKVKEKIKELGYSETQDRYIYALMKPGWFMRFMIGSYYSHPYIMSFQNDGILLLDISGWSGKMTDKHIFIRQDEISSIQFKKGLLKNKLIVRNNENKKTVFDCMKRVGRLQWHKEGLLWLEEEYGR